MGLFQRVSDIISANLNELVDRFEDPEKMLRQAMREMEEAIGAVTSAAAGAIANERMLLKETANHEQRSAEWRARAETALASGDEALARRALQRKHEHEKLAQALREQEEAARATSATLRRQVEAMRAKHAEARRKLAALTARHRAAAAHRSLQATLPGPRDNARAFSQFDRFCERVELLEAEATALQELNSDLDQELQSDFESRQDQERIEAELAELRERLRDQAGGTPPRPPHP
jgi:phage shock protein A